MALFSHARRLGSYTILEPLAGPSLKPHKDVTAHLNVVVGKEVVAE
jgi:hypothetical protein